MPGTAQYDIWGTPHIVGGDAPTTPANPALLDRVRTHVLDLQRDSAEGWTDEAIAAEARIPQPQVDAIRAGTASLSLAGCERLLKLGCCPPLTSIILDSAPLLVVVEAWLRSHDGQVRAVAADRHPDGTALQRLAERVGTTYDALKHALHRMRASGTVNAAVADALGVACGQVIDLIYGPDWDVLPDADETAEAAPFVFTLRAAA